MKILSVHNFNMDELDITKELLKKLDPAKGPLSRYTLCTIFKTDVKAYEEFRANRENKAIVEELDGIILESLYKESFKNKIARGIDLYIANEIPKSTTGIVLTVHNDINEFQKQLQTFDINNKFERIDIQNKRDEIAIIGAKTLDELGMEIIDPKAKVEAKTKKKAKKKAGK